MGERGSVGDAGNQVAFQLVEAELTVEGPAGGGQSHEGRQGGGRGQFAEEQGALLLLGVEPGRVNQTEPQGEARAGPGVGESALAGEPAKGMLLPKSLPAAGP